MATIVREIAIAKMRGATKQFLCDWLKCSESTLRRYESGFEPTQGETLLQARLLLNLFGQELPELKSNHYREQLQIKQERLRQLNAECNNQWIKTVEALKEKCNENLSNSDSCISRDGAIGSDDGGANAVRGD